MLYFYTQVVKEYDQSIVALSTGVFPTACSAQCDRPTTSCSL